MKGIWIVSALAGMLCCATAARAADDAAFDDKQWELTPYLKGTAPHIRDLLNGEAERITGRIKTTEQKIVEAKNDCKADEEASIERARKSPAYQKAAAETKKAEEDLAAARKSGSASDRLDASSRFNKGRLAMETIEHEAVTTNTTLDEDRHRLYLLEKDLKRYRETLDKATKWREHLLEATRNGFCIKGPVKPDSKGILGKVTVKKVIDKETALVEYDAPELLAQGKDKEGIQTYSARYSRLKVLATGIDTKGMKAGETTFLDHTFIITKIEDDEVEGKEYVASPHPSEADKLLDLIIPLRTASAE
ncbi:MAG: hypothetical protein JWM97_2711 [Phycisphaerales bacterium]|nr:hypothetical protein [Phycisphaerales bacterium]